MNNFFLTFRANLIGCICFVCFGGNSVTIAPQMTSWNRLFTRVSSSRDTKYAGNYTGHLFFFSFECWLSFVFSGFEPFCKQFVSSVIKQKPQICLDFWTTLRLQEGASCLLQISCLWTGFLWLFRCCMYRYLTNFLMSHWEKTNKKKKIKLC